MPMLNVGSANDRLAFAHRFDCLSLFLIKASAADDDESLSRRVGVPVAPRTRLERHAADRVVIALLFSERASVDTPCP